MLLYSLAVRQRPKSQTNNYSRFGVFIYFHFFLFSFLFF